MLIESKIPSAPFARIVQTKFNCVKQFSAPYVSIGQIYNKKSNF